MRVSTSDTRHDIRPGSKLDDHGTEKRTLEVIPTFYRSKRSSSLSESLDENGLQKALAKVKRNEFLRLRQHSLINNQDMEKAWQLLRSHAYCPDKSTYLIDYSGFMQVSSKLPEKFRVLFRPSIFMRFHQDDAGRIDVRLFYNFITRRTSLMQARFIFGIHDSIGDGYLRDSDLDSYIMYLTTTMPQLEKLPPTMRDVYRATTKRKVHFMLDPKRTGRVSIKSILLSPIMTELFELKEKTLSSDLEQTNWFTVVSVMEVYQQFMALDENKSGGLDRKEVVLYANGRFVDAFYDRIFQEYVTKKEMSYDEYLTMVLAVENMGTASAMSYFFKLFDLESRGYLMERDLAYFLKSGHDKLAVLNMASMPVKTLINEIFDMAHPAQEDRITPKDLERCGSGSQVVSMLIDATACLPIGGE